MIFVQVGQKWGSSGTAMPILIVPHAYVVQRFRPIYIMCNSQIVSYKDIHSSYVTFLG